jgi:hypothetical protein
LVCDHVHKVDRGSQHLLAGRRLTSQRHQRHASPLVPEDQEAVLRDVLAATTSLVLSTAGAASAADYDAWHPPVKNRDGEHYSTAEIDKVVAERCKGPAGWWGQSVGTDCYSQHTSGHFDWSQTPFSPDLPGYRLDVVVGRVP